MLGEGENAKQYQEELSMTEAALGVGGMGETEKRTYTKSREGEEGDLWADLQPPPFHIPGGA